jgi:hypothetical protein
VKPAKLLENWLPPDGAGDAVACLATSYTFEADFFAEECLARFLRLSGRAEGVPEQVAILEEEERLAETRVVVVADRNCGPDKRNLRWDLLPASVPGGLLHAKVALLIWRRAMRIIIGSANLSSAGYRRQIETGVAFDIENDQGPPREFVLSFLDELTDILLEHTKGRLDGPGPKSRALEILGIARERSSRLGLSGSWDSKVRVSLAPGRPGMHPLAGRTTVWRGGPPRHLVALSPFWDEAEEGSPAVRALVNELAKRSLGQDRPSSTFIVRVEAGTVVAPKNLTTAVPSRVSTRVVSLDFPSSEPRLLHAKGLLYEGDDCTAVMVGSSNLTSKGLGLDSRAHREINVWFGVASDTPEAEWLRSLLPCGEPIGKDWIWESREDEDENCLEPLPDGFADALIAHDPDACLQLALNPKRLPDRWTVRTPEGDLVLDDEGWSRRGRPEMFSWPLGQGALPSALDVCWHVPAGEASATWPVNVADLGKLPPAPELRSLPVNVLLRVLASTRPLPAALEYELLNSRDGGRAGADPLDPLERFDCEGLLLYRVRRASTALWGLQRRLERPITSVDTLDWRLTGPVGPLQLARGLVDEATSGLLRPAEAAFLIAELALTVRRVDWASAAPKLELAEVQARIRAVHQELSGLCSRVDLRSCAVVDGLPSYIREVFGVEARP